MPARTILCAIDFSAPAIAAARTSATLAARSDATLVLAHVHPFVTGFGCYRNAIEVYGSMLKNLADELRETGATVVEELLDGQTDEALLEASRRHRADLIVIASRKRRGITSRLLYGSLAEYLAEHAEAPTLVVRDAACLQDWLGQGKTLHTFTAVDLATASDAPLLWTRDFALLGPTEIAAGYVNWIPEEAARLGLKAPHSYFEETPEVRGVLERDLHQRVARVFGGTRVTTLVEPRWGQANLPLIELARRAAADVIVVGSRQRTGLVRILDEPVSRGLLHDAPMNVVIVPLNTAPPVEAPLPVYESVLLPTDFSPAAHLAIPHAYSLVAHGGTVVLLHVSDLPAENEAEILRILRSLVPEKAASRQILTQVTVATGQAPADGILRTAARLGVDAICMGSHGRSVLASALLGSVARGVIESSRCPVLLVRNH